MPRYAPMPYRCPARKRAVTDLKRHEMPRYAPPLPTVPPEKGESRAKMPRRCWKMPRHALRGAVAGTRGSEGTSEGITKGNRGA